MQTNATEGEHTSHGTTVVDVTSYARIVTTQRHVRAEDSKAKGNQIADIKATAEHLSIPSEQIIPPHPPMHDQPISPPAQTVSTVLHLSPSSPHAHPKQVSAPY